MTLLLDIAPFSPPASPSHTGRQIYQRFEEDSDLLAIAVVDTDGRPVGLVERNDFLVRMAAQYGYALWSDRPISHWMKTEPLVADGDMTVEEFCGRVLEERPSELLQVAESAQDALAAKGRFLAVMSHEIRTPLNGVLAVAEIIRRKSQQKDLAPLVDTILQSGGTLLRLLNDALDLARAEAAGLELNEEPMLASAIIDDVLGLWAAQAELKGVTLNATYSGPPDVWVLADRMRIQQVVNNLVGNAMKFTTSGDVDVRLHAECDGQYVRLKGEVADSGPGVPADRLQSIFTPFQQTEEGVRLGGAGLGLAVCRQILDRMDGVIEAMANPGGGALFTFAVPLHWLPEPERAAPAPDPVESAGGALHVLIVDDNATNRMVAQTLCEMFGCTRILAVTANADPADAAFYRACGMNGVVEKPVKPERLLAAMNAVLQAPVAPEGEFEIAAA